MRPACRNDVRRVRLAFVKKGQKLHDIQKLQRRLVGFHSPFRFSNTIVPPWPQRIPHKKLNLITAYRWFRSKPTSETCSNPEANAPFTASSTDSPSRILRLGSFVWTVDV